MRHRRRERQDDCKHYKTGIPGPRVRHDMLEYVFMRFGRIAGYENFHRISLLVRTTPCAGEIPQYCGAGRRILSVIAQRKPDLRDMAEWPPQAGSEKLCDSLHKSRLARSWYRYVGQLSVNKKVRRSGDGYFLW
jgi:hypothetical protein